MMENIPNAMTDEAKLQTSPEATNDASAQTEEEVKATVEETPKTETESDKQAEVPIEAPKEETVDDSSPAEQSESPAEALVQMPAEELEDVVPSASSPEDETVHTEDNETGNYTEDTDSEERSTIEVPDTKEGIIECLKELASHAEQSGKADLDILKQAFYKFIKDDKQKARAEFIKNGGKEEDFLPMPDPLEEEFKKVAGIIREQRAKLLQAAEKQKEINLEKKKVIIEKIKELASSPEEANKNFETFRKLQNEWKTIKPIPATAANEIWKNFQFCVEQYYDLLKTNTALRDYDFKKNLEAKTRLCEEAEALAEDNDIIHASRTLQELHQEFRETGPVAKDLREELWNRFKTASSAVNKRHAQYFEGIKEKEEENLNKKTAICEKIENIVTDNLQNFSAWDNITKKIIELQAEWKTIGHATKKMNNKIYERYRAACDNFFTKKTEFFKTQRKTFSENANLKTELCEKAEALKDSQEWSKATEEFLKLQKTWKESGTTAHKVGNALWERFNAACNAFFDQKKKVFGNQHKEESDNLDKKKSIIAQLTELVENNVENAAEKVQQLMDEWAQTGHVPFKDKDKIFAAYKEISDQLYKKFNLRSARKPMPQRNGGNYGNRSYSQPQRDNNSLYHQYEVKKSELNTYENNFSFLTAHSKKGNALIDSLQKKIDQLKEEAESILKKIKEQEQAAREDAKPATTDNAETKQAPTSEKVETTPEAVPETPAESIPDVSESTESAETPE